MKRLLTLDEKNYLDSMPVYERYNVRGVIVRDGRLAMQKSRLGEYKFIGGGVDDGESHETALCREVQEESGLIVLRNTIQPIGEILEKRLDIFNKTKIYLCHSFYYACEVDTQTVETNPTESEIRQGYALSWAAPQEILDANQAFLHKQWIARDMDFLRIWMKGQV